MKKLRLKAGTRVPVFGKDYRGFETEVWFTETPRDGWYWRPFEQGPLLPIEIGLARYYKVFGFIYLRHGFNSLAVWEHIAAMMYSGLTGVIVEGSPHPPYHGRVSELWDALCPNIIDTGDEVAWCRPVQRTEWRYPEQRAGFTRIEPHADPQNHSLDITIKIDYPGIGAVTKDFSFPAAWPVLQEAFRVHAQGYSRRKWWAACFLSMFGWPHINSICWPHEQSKEETTDLFLRHRLVDLLGGVSLASHDRLIAGRITSVCSGHLADLEVLRLTKFESC